MWFLSRIYIFLKLDNYNRYTIEEKWLIKKESFSLGEYFLLINYVKFILIKVEFNI